MTWPLRATLLACLGLALWLPAARAASEPTMETACFHASDRTRLCYVEQAAATPGPTLVFVPGWTMPAAIWEKQLAHFAGKVSLIAFDPRGQGNSAVPDDGYTLERRTQDLDELLGHFPGRSFVLVGWSLAALESLAYIDRYGAGRLRGLVLVDSSLGLGDDPPPQEGENPFFAELLTQREKTLRDFAAAIFRDDPGPALAETILASALKTNVDNSIRLLSYGKPRSYWRGIVETTALPILYAVTPRYADQAQALKMRQPQAMVDIFAEAGHALFHDDAGRFNAALEDFLQRIALPSASP